MKTIETTVPTAFNLQPGDRVIIVAAHPDDESVAHGQLIRTLTEAGVEVHVVIATDGTESTLGNPHLVQNGHRRSEAQNALAEAGIPLDRQHYLGEHDGQLYQPDTLGRIVQYLASLVDQQHTKAIFTPDVDGFDGHSDHIAMHDAALQAAKETAQPPAIWGLTRDPHAHTVALTVDTQAKYAMVAQHVTQFPGMLDTHMPAETAAYLRQYDDLMHEERYTLY